MNPLIVTLFVISFGLAATVALLGLMWYRHGVLQRMEFHDAGERHALVRDETTGDVYPGWDPTVVRNMLADLELARADQSCYICRRKHCVGCENPARAISRRSGNYTPRHDMHEVPPSLYPEAKLLASSVHRAKFLSRHVRTRWALLILKNKVLRNPRAYAARLGRDPQLTGIGAQAKVRV